LTGHVKGSPSIVSLPTREQRVLEVIEGDLGGCAPRLVSLFAIFTRLTKDDGAPLTESLQHVGLHRRIWLHSRLAAELVLAVPLALGLVALVAFLTLSSSGTHGCRPDSAGPYNVAASPVIACQTAAQKP
jgi:hypothetical protein